MAKHALQPARPNLNKIKLIIPLITAGALLSCTAAIAQADTGQHNLQAASVVTQQNSASTDLQPVAEVTPEIVAPVVTKINFERPAVTSIAAPKPAPAPVAPDAAKDAIPAAAPATADPAAAAAPVAAPATAVAQVATASPANPANIPAAGGATATTSGTGATDAFGEKIVAAALAQANINVQQDCTMLVTNSLKAIGIDFHDWPAGYLSLGQTTTNPQPGDLIYYKDGGSGMAHIAVYIGTYGGKSGMAVHGGFDGHNTKIFSANVGSGPIYIHVKR